MYVFNRVTVTPQLPKKINKLSEISNNLWWSWNTEFLQLFKMIDKDLKIKANLFQKLRNNNIINAKQIINITYF